QAHAGRGVPAPDRGRRPSGGARVISYALTDSWTMTRRELARWGRRPVAVVVNLVFPVMLLLMFGYLVGGGRGVDGSYLDFLLPGMLALTMAFGLEGTMVAVTQDLDKGVVDRFRSLPMTNGAVLVGRSAADMLQSVLGRVVPLAVGAALGWRPPGGPAPSLPMTNGAVLVGRSAADMLQSVLGLVVLLAVAAALGWRPHGGPAAFLTAVGLLLLLRFAMLWIGIHLALVAGRPEMVQAVQIL